MAKTVYTPEHIELQDGTPVTLRPLVIGRLKQAMKVIDEPLPEDDETPAEDAGLEFLLTLTKICLQDQLPEDFDYEMAVDAVTAKRVILVGTGIDFDDTNLMIQAAATAAAAEQSGVTSTS